MDTVSLDVLRNLYMLAAALCPWLASTCFQRSMLASQEAALLNAYADFTYIIRFQLSACVLTVAIL
jgi:hypothetical protein